MIHYRGPCGCLVGLTRLLPMTPYKQTALVQKVGISMFAVSLAVIVYDWIAKKLEQGRERGEGNQPGA